MANKKSIIKGSLVASAMLAVSSFSANASIFRFNSLGSGEEVRTILSGSNHSAKNLDLKCGEKGKSDSTAMKGKDGKCGEGKCGDKKDKKAKKMKKGKEGKCGEDKKKG